MTFTTLEDLCLDIIDCPHSSPEWKKSGVPVIRNFNLNNTGIDLSNLSYVDEGTYEQRIKRAKPEAGDIVISREAPMGVVGIIPDGLKCCLGQRLVLLKVDKEKCDPYYLLYVLGSNYVQTQIRRIDLTGSIVSNLNIPDLKKIVIPVIDGQQRVAILLQAITRKVESNNKINAELESMAKTIYDYWFLQFEFPNEEGKPYKSSGGKMVWNDELKREIPEGWDVKNIKDIASLTYGQCPDGENILDKNTQGENLLDYCSGAGDMKGGFLVDCQAKTNASRRLAHDDDILISIAGKIGDMCVSDHTISLGRAAMAVTAKKKDETMFIYLTLKSLNKKLCTIASGSIQKVINDTNINELNFPYSEKVVSKFNIIGSNIIQSIKRTAHETQELEALRDFLLPLLMNGQVSFKDE